ncbi:MAG: hypothetical protein NTV29_05655 [Planctomycetota bacterium]|nr:hypothetical protein [Planctomycetota bacterium]
MVHDSPERLIIGVDAGGSKTKACLALSKPPSSAGRSSSESSSDWTQTLRVIGTGEAGPGNPRSVGFDTVYVNLLEAISQAFQNAGVAQAKADAICVSMAGVGQADQRTPVARWVEQANLADRIRVSEDVTPIRWAALWETRLLNDSLLHTQGKRLWNNSVTLISGTGSIVSATRDEMRESTGETDPLVEVPLHSARVGGWGYLLGDEGSGFAIGLSALKEVCRAHDAGDEFSPLHRAVLKELGCDGAIDLIPRIYTQPIPRPKIASLYQTVVQFASSDLIASKLLEYASLDLAELIVSGASRIGLQPGQYGLAFSGGTLTGKSPLVPTILRHLERMQMGPALSHQVSDPVIGAVVMASMLDDSPASRVE